MNRVTRPSEVVPDHSTNRFRSQSINPSIMNWTWLYIVPRGDEVTLWVGWGSCNQEVPGSNLPLCQLQLLLISNKFTFLFAAFVFRFVLSPIDTTVLNIQTVIKWFILLVNQRSSMHYLVDPTGHRPDILRFGSQGKLYWKDNDCKSFLILCNWRNYFATKCMGKVFS